VASSSSLAPLPSVEAGKIIPEAPEMPTPAVASATPVVAAPQPEPVVTPPTDPAPAPAPVTPEMEKKTP
jgi:hypothetical protein